MSNSLVFSNIRGFACCNNFSSNSHQRFSMRFNSGDCDGHCRIVKDFFCKQALVEFEVCLGSLSCWKVQRRPSFSFLSLGTTYLSWYTEMNQSCRPHAAGFQCQRMQSSPKVSQSDNHWKSVNIPNKPDLQWVLNKWLQL